jgi:transcriptional regulator with XRE-family HTH domain
MSSLPQPSVRRRFFTGYRDRTIGISAVRLLAMEPTVNHHRLLCRSLRWARQQRHWSIAQLAIASDLPPERLRQIEAGIVPPLEEELQTLAIALDLDAAELMALLALARRDYLRGRSLVPELLRARLDRRLSAAALEARIGMERGLYLEIELGERLPTDLEAEAIARVFGEDAEHWLACCRRHRC